MNSPSVVPNPPLNPSSDGREWFVETENGNEYGPYRTKSAAYNFADHLMCRFRVFPISGGDYD